MKKVELETERLRLRMFEESDLDSLLAIYSNPEAARWVGGVQNRAQCWRTLAAILGHWQLRGYGIWAVEDKASGEFVGRIGLQQPEGWPEIEVAWTVTPSRWGEGIAPEAARAALEFGWDELGLDHVISQIAPENKASLRVAAKIGETFERSGDLFGTPVEIWGIYRGKQTSR